MAVAVGTLPFRLGRPIAHVLADRAQQVCDDDVPVDEALAQLTQLSRDGALLAALLLATAALRDEPGVRWVALGLSIPFGGRATLAWHVNRRLRELPAIPNPDTPVCVDARSMTARTSRARDLHLCWSAQR
jgi:hypothetical protein